jgi:hypothetical protein
VAMDCEKLPTCIFFNDEMADMPAVAALLKNQFCRGAFAECARYQVATRLGVARVPKDLYPQNRERAKVLLGSDE